jgi:NAD(P)H-hydrate epimerase
LTLPKLGVKEFKGRHFLGGRFIPSRLKEKYNMILPNYKGLSVL